MLPYSHMTKTILVHGYAVGLKASIFRQPLGEHAGFSALNNEIITGDVKTFRWSKNIALSLFQSANPFQYLKLYRDEEKFSQSSETQSALFDCITTENPSTIICHSLGCRLMIGMMNAHGIPQSISKIILLQGDVPTSTSITNSSILDRLTTKTLTIENYHCWWDQSLLASSIVHRENRIGLMGWKHAGVKNIFYPLLKPLNLHTSPMRDREFLPKIINT